MEELTGEELPQAELTGESSLVGRVQGLRKPRRGDQIEVTVERLDVRGRACASHSDDTGDYRVLLRNGIPGQRARVRVLKRRGHKLDCGVLEVLERAPGEVEPRCRLFGVCGGCSFQNLAYERQLEFKHGMLVEVLAKAELHVEVAPVLGAEDPWRYRNKMDFTFSTRRWIEDHEPEGAPQGFGLGLHPSGQFRRVLDIESCVIQSELSDAILCSARRIALEQELEPWSIQEHKGLLRHLVVRHASTGELLINVVTSTETPELVPPYAAALVAAHPEITTLVQTINERSGQTAVGQHEVVLHGPGTIQETLHGLHFTLSAGSFFQTNSAQAERLLDVILEEAQLQAGDVVHDLYCGAGAIGLACAAHVREVWGFEVVASAVRDGRANAQANGIENIHFIAGDLAHEISNPSAPAPDVCIIDPPRAGLHPKVLGALGDLREAGARRLVYVSCNPRAAAGDVGALVAKGWRLVRVRPVDLFPHTPHVETVLTLERDA